MLNKSGYRDCSQIPNHFQSIKKIDHYMDKNVYILKLEQLLRSLIKFIQIFFRSHPHLCTLMEAIYV